MTFRSDPFHLVERKTYNRYISSWKPFLITATILWLTRFGFFLLNFTVSSIKQRLFSIKKNVLHFTLIVINSKIAKFGPKMQKNYNCKNNTSKMVYTENIESHIYMKHETVPPPHPHIPPPKNIDVLHDCSVPPFLPQKLVWEKNLGVQKDTTTV